MVHVAVSADGKTRTATYSGKTADGKVVHTVMVYDKRESERLSKRAAPRAGRMQDQEAASFLLRGEGAALS